jgi:hydantoinase/carbamoylase family amidase
MKTMKNHVVTRLHELGAIGRHEHGIYRGHATPQEHAARALYASWARAGSYRLSQDAVGNLFVRRAGTNDALKPILVGSHLDTVQTGGAYDGAYGVVGALCALELLDANDIATDHPIEAVAWAGEEGSRFPLGCLGSSVYAGLWKTNDALNLVGDDGVMLRDAMASSSGGLLPGVPMRTHTDVAAYLELHVEQGPVMEAAGVSLGIVTAIASQRRLRATVIGVSGHAGTVPMTMRADALCAASELVLAIEAASRDLGDSVATVGRMIVEPNGTNVVPGHVTFSIDLRSPDVAKLDTIEERFADAIARVKRERGVSVEIETLERRLPTIMTPALRDAIGRAIASLGEKSVDVPSGAGHDAMSLGRIVPTAMIFVPSIGGRSHVDEERTEPHDLELGVEALAASVVEVDRILEKN